MAMLVRRAFAAGVRFDGPGCQAHGVAAGERARIPLSGNREPGPVSLEKIAVLPWRLRGEAATYPPELSILLNFSSSSALSQTPSISKRLVRLV